MSTLSITADQTKVLEAIRYFCRKYESAFPTVSTLAKIAGMCTRKCADHIRELVELGRIRKEQRWEDGRQLSNRYEIIEPQPEPEKVDADYKSSNNSFIKPSDDDYRGTHIRQLEFVQLAQKEGVTLPVLKIIFPHIRKTLIECSYSAMYEAIRQYHRFKDGVSSLGSWFKTVLNDWNERLKKGSAPARI